MFWSEQMILRFLRLFLLCSMVIALTFSALGTDYRSVDSYRDSEDELIENAFLDAKIIEIEEDSMLAEPINKFKEFDEILVYMGLLENDFAKVLEEGDLVRIEYNGSIQETIPPRVTALQIEKNATKII